MSRVDEWLPPTPERIAKGDITIEETERGGREVRSVEHPLREYFLNHFKQDLPDCGKCKYCRKGKKCILKRGCSITPTQYRAGLILMSNYAGAGLSSHYAQVKYSVDPTGQAEPGRSTDSYIAYCEAMEAIRGLTEKRVAFAVCCMGECFTNCGVFSSGRTARRHGGVYLTAALDDLVKHYELDK